MGWDCVLALCPAAWEQFPSVYNDLQVGFFLVTATYFATRAGYRVRDAAIAIARANYGMAPAPHLLPSRFGGRAQRAHLRSASPPISTISSV